MCVCVCVCVCPSVTPSPSPTHPSKEFVWQPMKTRLQSRGYQEVDVRALSDHMPPPRVTPRTLSAHDDAIGLPNLGLRSMGMGHMGTLPTNNAVYNGSDATPAMRCDIVCVCVCECVHVCVSVCVCPSVYYDCHSPVLVQCTWGSPSVGNGNLCPKGTNPTFPSFINIIIYHSLHACQCMVLNFPNAE